MKDYLSITVKTEKFKDSTIIATYNPNQDDNEKVENKFWNDLPTLTDLANNEICIARKSRKQPDRIKKCWGRFGEDARNANFCVRNNY